MSYIRNQVPLSMDDAVQRIGKIQPASPNKYYVVFSMPYGAGGVGSGSNDNLGGVAKLSKSPNIRFVKQPLGDISIQCQSMSFPGRSMAFVESRHIGAPFKLPYGATYDDITFTFNLSSDFAERKFFEVWQQAVVNVGVNSVNFYDEYVAPVYLLKLDNSGKVTYQVNLVEAYPISIDNVDSAYGMRDEVQTCSVTMAYRHWVNEDIQ